DRGHGRHQDRAQAQEASLVDRIARGLALVAFGVEGEVDHHDRVFLDDADQQHDADDGDDVEIVARDDEGEQSADAGGRQRREDRHRVDKALIENAQHDVDGDYGGQDQEQLVLQRGLEAEGGALEAGQDAGRQFDVALDPGHGVDGRTQ